MIKVGVVGLGLAARHFHIPLLNALPLFKVTAVLSSQSASEISLLVGDVSVMDDFLEFCQSNDYDLAIVLTPNHLHFEQCQTLLKSGKHVVVDKPFTVTMQQAELLKLLSIKCNKLLSVFQNRRWDSDFLTVKYLNNKNSFGNITYFESRFDKYRPKISKKWKDSNVPGGGILYDLLPHLADQAFQLFGYPLLVTSSLKIQRKNSEVCDYFHVRLTYPSVEVILRASSLAAVSPFRFYIEGDKGTYVKKGLDGQEQALAKKQYNLTDWIAEPKDNYGQWYEKDKEKIIEPVQGDYRQFYLNIANALNGKERLKVTVDDAIATIKVIELAIQSAELNCSVAW